MFQFEIDHLTMLSIAIKNSMILALVILIAHFLLKNSGDDRLFATQRKDASTTASQVSLSSGVASDAPHNSDAPTRSDDLYSYVYGASSDDAIGSIAIPTPTNIPESAPPQTTPSQAALPAPLQNDGMLTGYDGGLSDQWCMIEH